ncbi:unnamed protein product, partial [Discosporangium mesarthrocarpum]
RTEVSDGSEPGSDATSSPEQQDKLKVLLEFIPYFGQGDAAQDNIVRAILSNAVSGELSGRDEYGNTLLILACQYHCESLVPIVLNRGEGSIDLDATNSAGACALHFACYKDSLSPETAILLLRRGVRAEVVENTYGCTPLHYAAGAGDVDLCKALIESGAKTETCDFYNFTAIDYAKQSGMPECISYL